jgi:hypothetical protein
VSHEAPPPLKGQKKPGDRPLVGSFFDSPMTREAFDDPQRRAEFYASYREIKRENFPAFCGSS